MSRKDLELIAFSKRYGEDYGEPPRLAERFADQLHGTNPRFDRGRFLRAAMPGPAIPREAVAS